MKNPVMFIVEVGSVLTTVLLVTDHLRHQGHFNFDLQITLWLWFTVLFANFAEAMAEGRGKAQADALHRANPRPRPTLCVKMAPKRFQARNCGQKMWSASSQTR